MPDHHGLFQQPFKSIKEIIKIKKTKIFCHYVNLKAYINVYFVNNEIMSRMNIHSFAILVFPAYGVFFSTNK